MRVNLFSQSGVSNNNGLQPSQSATITGPLVLVGNPTGPLEAAPKQYVDTVVNTLNAVNIKSGTLSAARLPAFTGDVSSATGSGNFVLSNSGVTAGTYTKATVDSKGRVLAGSNLTIDDIPPFSWSKIATNKPTTVDGYGITDALKVGGSTITGTLSLNVDPTSGLHAATKQYVDGLSNNGASVATGSISRRPVSTTPAGFLRANGGLLSRTTYSALFAVVKSASNINVTFDTPSYGAVGGGQPWKQQYDFAKTQTGDIANWSVASTMPAVVSNHCVVVTKNRVYTLGGYVGGAYASTCYTAPINTDGSIGAWTGATALPGILYESQAIVTENRVYLMGGIDSSDTTAVVYTCAINADGTLGAWTTSASLPGSLSSSQAFVTKNRVYLCGGRASTNYVSTVYTAPINTDGTLGAWTTGTALPVSLAYAQAVVTNNRVYLIGGRNSAGVFSNVIYTATIGSDGRIGAWSSYGTIPAAISMAQTLVVRNHVYLFAGNTSASTNNLVYRAPVNADGTLGAWVSGTGMQYNVCWSQAVVTKNHVLLFGGYNGAGSYHNYVFSGAIADGINDYTPFYDGSINTFNGTDLTGVVVVGNNYDDVNTYPQPGNGQPWVQQYGVNSQQTADLGTWSSGTGPAALTCAAVFMTKNRVYVVGGYSGSTTYNTVYTAVVNANGTLGTWTAGTAFPAALYGSTPIVVKNRVYMFGGAASGGGTSNVIYMALINADGTIGAWSNVGTLPASGYFINVFITNKRIYAATGMFSYATYTTTINDDGTLNAWTTGPALPYRLSGSVMAVTRNRVYLMGGNNSDGSTQNTFVLTASINTDGTLGTWTSGTSLPVTLGSSMIYVTQSRVWIIAGSQGSTGIVGTILTAPINADGTIGTWTTSPNGTSAVYCTSVVATSNYIYMIGGGTGTGGSTASPYTYYTAIVGGTSDYTKYYDGSITAIDTTNFLLPDLSAIESTNEFYFVKY